MDHSDDKVQVCVVVVFLPNHVVQRRHLCSSLQVKSFHTYSTYESGLDEGWVNDDGGTTVREGGLWQSLLAVGLAITGTVYKKRLFSSISFANHCQWF